jgi:preprotein translocase subunit SecE
VKAQRGFESLPLRQFREARKRASWKFFVNNWTTILIWSGVIAAVFGYLWWQGQIRRFAVYCQETWEELKKCAWPSWNELKGSTVLIAICIALLGGFISGMDFLLNFIFFKL